jgi:hypothetical protein
LEQKQRTFCTDGIRILCSLTYVTKRRDTGGGTSFRNGAISFRAASVEPAHQRSNAYRPSTGSSHVDQRRFKSFPVREDDQLAAGA